MTQKTHCQWSFKITSSDNGMRVTGMQDIATLGDIFKIADVFVVLAPRPTVYKCCGWMFRSSFGGRRPEAKREECSWRRLWLSDTVLAITKWHSDGSVLEVSGTVKQCKIWAAWHVNFFLHYWTLRIHRSWSPFAVPSSTFLGNALWDMMTLAKPVMWGIDVFFVSVGTSC